MDKKGTKILLGCILCTMIVLMLFIIVIKFTQLSCELVALEPVALRNSQLDQFKKDTPIRSKDKTILIKISAFLEYNVQETSSSSSSDSSSSSSDSSKSSHEGGGPRATPTGGAQGEPPRLTINNANLNGNNAGQAAVVAPGQGGGQHQGGSNNKSLTGNGGGGGPQPSVPQNNFNPLQNSSFVVATKPLAGQHQAVNYGQRQHPRAEKRFLPLELDTVDTRNLGNDKHRYILSFNCTKLNMILVHVNNTVYVEHMDMELKPVGIRQKATCELTLAGGRAFMVPPPAAVGPVPMATVGQHQQPSSSPAPHLNVMTNVTNAAHPAPSSSSSSATGASPAAQSDRASSKKDDARNLARYFCDKPLRFECHYWNKKPGPTATNGFLLADLQINAIEFETARGPTSKGEHRHVKSEFKSKRSVCM